jgi:hypothetical protein
MKAIKVKSALRGNKFSRILFRTQAPRGQGISIYVAFWIIYRA